MAHVVPAATQLYLFPNYLPVQLYLPACVAGRSPLVECMNTNFANLSNLFSTLTRRKTLNVSTQAFSGMRICNGSQPA